jgi:hypothetical protein
MLRLITLKLGVIGLGVSLGFQFKRFQYEKRAQILRDNDR